MTVAICLKCGTEKFGVLTACRKCAFVPQDVIDRAKSTVLSDHHYDAANLQRLGEDIREGKTPELPQDEVDQYIALYESELIKQQSEGKESGCLPAILGMGAAVLIPIAFVVVMVLGFAIAARIIGRPPTSPLDEGTVVEIQLTSEDATQLIGKNAAVFYDYVRIDFSDRSARWIPREQVQYIELEE